MVFKNYTGDRLNFGIAAERAKSEGIKVEMVIVGEDTAMASSGRSAGRRGLCGALFVSKIAGALAERGCSFDEVLSVAQRVADSIATMSVSLSPCSIPGNKPSFELGPNEMELGLGIHGEAGVKRTMILPADDVVAHMIDHMTSSEPGYGYFNIKPGEEVCVFINNLGGTSNLEVSVMAGSTVSYLTDKLGLKVSRVFMGALMTSLEMAGVSISLLKVTSPQWKECLDLATTAPGWPNQSLGPDGTAERRDTPALVCAGNVKKNVDINLTTPTTEKGQVLKRCVVGLSEVLITKEEELNELDRGCGDGDCGTTFKLGAEAIVKDIDNIPWDTPSKALLKVSEIVEKHMGGTSGAIYTLFITSGSCCLEGDTVTAEDWLLGLQAGINAITKYGGASVGDRTMLDAIVPAFIVLKDGLTTSKDISKTLLEAVKAARTGADKTKTMAAQAGRASYVDPSLVGGKVDPGAEAVVIWLQAIVKEIVL